MAAFLKGDSAAYTTAFTELAKQAATTLTHAEQQAIHQEAEALVKGLPLPLERWQELIKHTCWARAKLDDKAVAEGVQTILKNGSESKKRGK